MSLHELTGDEALIEGWKRKKATERRRKGSPPYAASTHFSLAFTFAFTGTFLFSQHSRLLSSKNCEEKPERDRHSIFPCFVCRALFPVRVRVAAGLRSLATDISSEHSLRTCTQVRRNVRKSDVVYACKKKKNGTEVTRVWHS